MKLRRDTEKRGKGSASAAGLRKRVLLLDGDRLTTVTLRGNTPTKVDVKQHPSPSAAIAAARRQKGRGTRIVWQSRGQESRSSRETAVDMHPRSRARWQAEQMRDAFQSAPSASRTSEEGTLIVGLQLEDKQRWVTSGNVVPGAFAVGQEDGAWLHVGWDEVSLSLVSEGDVVFWEKLPTVGIAALEAEVADSPESGAQRTAQWYDELSRSAEKRISEWQTQGHIAKRVLLHGPGVRAPEKLRLAVSQHIGMPVSEGWENMDTGEGGQHLSSLPAALAAFAPEVPRFASAQSLLDAPARRRRILVGAAVGLFVVIASVMWWQSNSQGQKVQDRIAAAEERQTEAETLRAGLEEELAALEQENADVMDPALEEIRGLLDELADESPWPDWDRLRAMQATFADAGLLPLPMSFDMAQARSAAFSFDMVGIPGGLEGNLRMRDTLDQWLAAVWGPCVEATYGSQISIDSDPFSTSSLNPVVSLVADCETEPAEVEDAESQSGEGVPAVGEAQ